MHLHEMLQQLSHGVCEVLSTMIPTSNDQPLAIAKYALVLEELVHAGRANHGCSYMRYLLVAEKTCQTMATAQHDYELPAMQYTNQTLRWYLRPLRSCAQRLKPCQHQLQARTSGKVSPAARLCAARSGGTAASLACKVVPCYPERTNDGEPVVLYQGDERTQVLLSPTLHE
jgi:hypothetical protein